MSGKQTKRKSAPKGKNAKSRKVEYDDEDISSESDHADETVDAVDEDPSDFDPSSFPELPAPEVKIPLKKKKKKTNLSPTRVVLRVLCPYNPY